MEKINRSKIEIEGQYLLLKDPGYDVSAAVFPHVKTTGCAIEQSSW